MCCYCFWGCDSLSARRLVESENVRGRRKTAFNRGGRGECPQRALRKLITAKGAKKSRAKDAKERCNHRGHGGKLRATQFSPQVGSRGPITQLFRAQEGARHIGSL